MPKLSGEKFYKREYKKILQMVDDQCKTAEQYAQICAMSLSRCYLQLAATVEFFPQANILPGYERILSDMECFACDNQVITAEMARGYEDWCIQVTELLDHGTVQNKSYPPHWRLQLLPGLIEKLGTFFVSGIPPYWDDIEISLVGAWLLFVCETGHKHPNPRNFNYYMFIRSKHLDIEAIGKERDELRAKLSKSVTYYDAYEAISDTYKNECKKYWSEAVAEHQCLKAEYHPLAPEDLVLTMCELERIRADVQFVTTENRTKETIRQRLQYYRTLDIAEEQRT
nr:hypothetical protein [uncultured Oscillibacter sp.]